MNKIFVIGHKNPDTDAICSAYCYAKLKNLIDKNKNYIAARCGTLNAQTKHIFEMLSLKPPVFIKDVYPKVEDCMTENVVYSRLNDPIYDVMKHINELKIRLTPIVDENKILKSIVSIMEITDFYISFDAKTRPVYLLREENIEKVVGGEFIRSSNKVEFLAHILIAAMPYERFKAYFATFDPSKLILITGRRVDIIEYAAKHNVSGIILTGFNSINELRGINFKNYNGFLFLSKLDTAETFRKLIMSVPAKFVMRKKCRAFKRDMYLEEAKEILIRENSRGLPVVDDDNRLIGILTRSDLLKKFRHRLILTDHNELSQSVDGAEAAEILEIIDHHRLGNIKTHDPVFFYAKPIGSSCSLVYELYKQSGNEIDYVTAKLLLSGILSDTVILKSPTTTERDIDIAKSLAKIAGVDINEFGREIFSTTESLQNMHFDRAVSADLKVYHEFDTIFGIGQIEVVTLTGFNEVKSRIIEALKTLKSKKHLDWAVLLITDIIDQNSILVSTPFMAEKLLSYKRISEHTFYLPGVLSRKKQLLPEILRVLEELKEKKIT